MEKIKWIKLNKNGLIINSDDKILKYYDGIYAYRFKSENNKLYIGSAIYIAQRFRQHRYRFSIYNGYNNKFYNLVKKYAWDKFEYAILDKIVLSSGLDL